MKLKKEGHPVERIAINQQPQRFMSKPIIKEIINHEGNQSLPITLIGDKKIMKGRYPTDTKEVSQSLFQKACCPGKLEGNNTRI